MRSFLIILVTLLVLGGLFVGYLVLAPTGGGDVATNNTLRVRPATTRASGEGLVSEAEGIVTNRFDDVTGELVSRFQASRFEQTAPDRMRVENPVAEFYDGDDLIRVTGSHGIIIQPPPPGGAEAQPTGEMRAGMPNRGQLYDVRIDWFNSPAAVSADAPMLTLAMNNIAFDNDTFRIATEGYTTDQGQFVAGDQVPVTVQGEQMDFRGRGLNMRWNDRDRRLELLEIAHGESMTIRDPEALQRINNPDADESDAGTAPSTAPTAAPSPTTRPTVQTGEARIPPATQPATAPADRPRTPQPTYHAVFEQDVRIAQGEQVIGAGDNLVVNFRLPEQSRTRRPRSATTQSTSRPATRRARTPAAPAEPSDQTPPMIVQWTGRLRIVPLSTPLEQPLAAGESAIHFEGAPLKLHNDGWDVEATSLAYRSDTKTARLSGSDDRPLVTLRNADGSVITTKDLEHQSDAGIARLSGPGQASLPTEQEGAEPAILSASWDDVATFRFARADEDGEVAIEQADLTGHVKVDHPQLQLSADKSLALTFGAGESGDGAQVPPLQRAVARGNVVATVPSADGAAQTLRGETLDAETDLTSTGAIYPRTITVVGDAVASGPQGELRTGRLVATLTPAPEEEGTDLLVESFRAQDGMHYEGADGASADADQLSLEPTTDGPTLQLIGQPVARLSNGSDVLTGPMIRYQLRNRIANVLGAGTLHSAGAGEETGGQPVDVSWTGWMHVDGNRNLIELSDDVTVRTVQSDGTQTTATSDRVQITLRDIAMDTDEAKPANPPAHADGGVAVLGGESIDLLENKEAQTISMLDGVTVSSTLLSEQGEVLRQALLKAPRVEIDVPTRNLTIPEPGQMLVQDRLSTDERKAQGTTAFAWTDSLTYDSAAREAVMLGNVEISHVEPEDEAAFQAGEKQPVKIFTHRARAQFVPKDDPPTSKPSDALDGENLALHELIADGGVRVVAEGMEIDAEMATYDPQSKWLIAHGDDQRPVYVSDAAGDVSGTVREVRLNTETGAFEIERFQVRGRR